jgi:tetratricopeptide (TPR) repeat protein
VKLLIYRGESLERTLDLTDRDVRIGRGAENDVVLEDPEKTVSRFHAEMRLEGGGWVLFDLNSQNGIWIDGQRIQRQVLNPGQTAQLGNFRIILDGGANIVTAPPLAPAPEAMAATMVFSRDAPGAAVPGAPAAAAASPVAAPVPPSPPPPPPAQMAPAAVPKRPKLAPTGGEPKKGLTSIPRPIFYGGCLFFLLLIIGVMYVMRPRPIPPPPEPPPPQQTTNPSTPPMTQPSTPTTPAGPETNADIVARNLKDAQTKLDAGDAAGAIEAVTRALNVDPTNPAALDLKMKAEERRAQAAAATAAAGTPAAGTPASGTPASGTTPSTGANGGTTPTTAAAGTETPAKPVVDKAAVAAAREKRAERAAEAALKKRYQQAKAELTRGDYEHAVPDLEAINKDKPGYQDVGTLLDQAKSLRRADAQKQLTAGNTAAGKADYTGAMAAYQRAAKIDPTLAGVQDGMNNVRQKMRDEGEAAYRRARQLDAVGRTQDALPLYQKAVTLLPADDPSGKAARDRIEALKGQNP